MTIKLSKLARESAQIYAEAILDACRKVKVADPVAALVDTDDYPRLLKVANVEFAIGWFAGCAEAHGVLVEDLWAQVAPSSSKAKPRRKAA